MTNKLNFIFILGLVIALASPAMGATLVVPDTYATIAGALAVAVPGDTILIKPTYSSSAESYPITIGINNLTITGIMVWPPTTTLYNPDADSDGIEQGEDIFHLGAVDGVSIEYLAFEDCCFAITDAAVSDAKTDITIKRNTFSNCMNAGETGDSSAKYGYDGGAVHLSNISNSLINFNEVTGGGEGFYLHNSDYNTISHNVITNTHQFGVQLHVNYLGNEINYNNITGCKDRGIVLIDTGDWEGNNTDQKIGHNEVSYCNAEGILVWGCDNTTSAIHNNKVHHNCQNGIFDALGGSAGGTNYAGITLINTISMEVYKNVVHHNGETEYCPSPCYGGLAIITSKLTHIWSSVFYSNTGDGEDTIYDCAATFVSGLDNDGYDNALMEYCDIFDQNYGARNTSADACFLAKKNWWGNMNGPDDFSNGGCPLVYNPNAGYPKVDDKVVYSEFEEYKLAIELAEFHASPYLKNSIICEWSTGSEQDNAGFYIVKSENLHKGYTLVNNQLIPAKGNTVGGSDYSQVDDNVSPYTLYFYWLVDVSFDGTFTIHGPVTAVYESDKTYWESLR